MFRTGRAPAKDQTAADYHRRVERVVDMIRANPERPFLVGELAGYAAFSEFHFHRVFRAVTGESVAQCIMRLRLEMAGSALIYQRQTLVTEIALSCGFSSSANFSKAFRKAYNCTPTQYRKDRPADFRMRRIGKALAAQPGYPESMSTDVEILDLPERNLASIRQTGPYSHTGISQLYAALEIWLKSSLGQPPPEEAISITWSDSALADQETWRLDACHDVPKGTKEAGRVAIRQLSGGRAACLRLSLSLDEMHLISDHWDWLFSRWLPHSGAEPADRPAYEMYRALSDKSGFEITLCLPLKHINAEHEND